MVLDCVHSCIHVVLLHLLIASGDIITRLSDATILSSMHIGQVSLTCLYVPFTLTMFYQTLFSIKVCFSVT